MPLFNRSRQPGRMATKADPVKTDPVKTDPVVHQVGSPVPNPPSAKRPVAKGETTASPVAPLGHQFAANPVDAAMDELVAALADAIVTQAGDEFEASWSVDDPVARVEDLLADARFEYGDVVVDRAEAEAYSGMLDAAQQLSDRLQDDDDGDDSGW